MTPRITTSRFVLAAAIAVALAGCPVAAAGGGQAGWRQSPFEPIPDPTQLHVGDCITVTRGNPMDPNETRKYFLRTTCRPNPGMFQVTSIVGFADSCPDQSAESQAADFRACYQSYR